MRWRKCTFCWRWGFSRNAYCHWELRRARRLARELGIIPTEYDVGE